MDIPKILGFRNNILADMAAIQMAKSTKKAGTHWAGTTPFISRKNKEGGTYSWGKAEVVNLTPVQRAKAKIRAKKADAAKSAEMRNIRQEVGGRLNLKTNTPRANGKFLPAATVARIKTILG